MEKIKKIMEMLEIDSMVKYTEKQVLAKKEIAEKLILTSKMDPFNSQDDAKKVLKILKKCQKIAVKNNLTDPIVSTLKFLEMIVLGKLETDLKENPEPVLDKEEALEINSLLKDLNDLLDETIGGIIKKDKYKITEDTIGKKAFNKLENLFNDNLSEDKDYECDLAELPSNFINGKAGEPSGVFLSKLMKIAFVKNDNETVSLTATNLPKEISKKEFKKLLKHTGLWLDKETILKEGNHYMNIRLLYSEKYITMLLVDKNIKIETKKDLINQKFVLVQKKIINGKPKIIIADFLNVAGMKVKDVVKVKGMRKFIKEVTFEEDINLVSDQYGMDDQNNFYRIGLPYIRESK